MYLPKGVTSRLSPKPLQRPLKAMRPFSVTRFCYWKIMIKRFIILVANSGVTAEPTLTKIIYNRPDK